MAGGQPEGGSWQRPPLKCLNGRRPVDSRQTLSPAVGAPLSASRMLPPPPRAARGPVPLAAGFRPLSPAEGLTRAPRPRGPLLTPAARGLVAAAGLSPSPHTLSPRPRPPGARQRLGRRACSPPQANKSLGRDRAPRPALPIGPRTLLAGGVILPKVQTVPLGHPRTPKANAWEGRKKRDSGGLIRTGEARCSTRGDPHPSRHHSPLAAARTRS